MMYRSKSWCTAPKLVAFLSELTEFTAEQPALEAHVEGLGGCTREIRNERPRRTSHLAADPHRRPAPRHDRLLSVEFRDITPKSEGARVVLIVQMLGDIALLGAGKRVLLGAVRRGQQGRLDRGGDARSAAR